MERIIIEKEFKTLDELNNSNEFIKLWEGFHLRKEKNEFNIKFIRAFTCKDGNIFVMNEVTTGKEKGLRFLRKISITCCLHNRPFFLGYIQEDPDGSEKGDMSIIIDNENGYDRSARNREILASQHRDNDISFVTTYYG